MTTLERILDTIEVITSEMDYIYDAIKNIDNSVPAKAQSIADVVTSREETHKRCIDLYEKILDSLDWEDFDEDDDIEEESKDDE